MAGVAGTVIGVDLGGTNARAALADERGTILSECSRPSESAGPPERTFDILADCIRDAIAQGQPGNRSVRAVGVGLPGIITRDGRCIWTPNFPEWRDVPIKKMLQERTSLPCFFLNDARCATLAEFHRGAGRGACSMVYVGLGTGIGGGIVMDGQLLLGRKGSVGEIAHHTIDPDGPLCGCGNFGCWESFCGRDAIIRRALRKLQSGRESSLAEARGKGEDLTPQIIAAAARDGDTLAGEVMDEVGGYLGIGVANLVNILNPERVVIGGGVAQAGELLLAPMRRMVQARAVRYQWEDCAIVPAELGSDAGIHGAVILAQTQSATPAVTTAAEAAAISAPRA